MNPIDMVAGIAPGLLSTLAPNVLTRMPGGARTVYLTFDDGPGAGTQALLGSMAARGAQGSFFLSGAAVSGSWSSVRQIVDEGHRIGLHGFAHLNAWRSGSEAAILDHERGREAICVALGGDFAVRYARPPYGKLTPGLSRWYAGEGVRPVLWDVDPRDYRTKPGEASVLIERVTARVRPGSIVLLHPDRDVWTRDPLAFDRLLDALLGLDYQLLALP